MVQILAGWICVPGVSVRCQKPKEDGFVRAHSEGRTHPLLHRASSYSFYTALTSTKSKSHRQSRPILVFNATLWSTGIENLQPDENQTIRSFLDWRNTQYKDCGWCFDIIKAIFLNICKRIKHFSAQLHKCKQCFEALMPNVNCTTLQPSLFLKSHKVWVK